MLYLIKKFLLALIGIGVRRGKITVSPGAPQEIEVYTRFTPQRISLTFCDFAMPSVCVGDVDCFDVKPIRQGFVIIAKIKGQSRTISWTAIER